MPIDWFAIRERTFLAVNAKGTSRQFIGPRILKRPVEQLEKRAQESVEDAMT